MSTFNPTEHSNANALDLARQVDKLVVVDDGSKDNSVLKKLAHPKIEIIYLEENKGIAAALNQGIRQALAENAHFILTMDQDTQLETGYVSALLNTFELASDTTHIGIVLTDCVNGQPSIPPAYSPEGFGLVSEGIQSGMLISAACLRSVGLLDEDLFIDCVDIEFCLRARDHQWQIAVSPGSNITHALGEQVPIRRWGKHSKRAAANTFEYHAPFRQYYITRNNIDLCFRNLRRRPRWVLSVIKRELRPTFLAVCAGPHRAKQALAVLMGTLHGLIRRRGKITNALNARLQS